ncbi:MAG: hypothetical protein ABJM43_00905 [Paracoccaceae bacterium]
MAALYALASWLILALPTSAEITDPDAFERFLSIEDWDQLCEVTDCDQFPIGYSTYAFGPEVYYFPTWSTMIVKPPHSLFGLARAGRLNETDSEGSLLRSVNVSTRAIISYCCHHLLTFYGLSEAMPIFIENPRGNRMPITSLSLSRFDDPGRYNNIQRWLDYDLGEFPRLDEVISKDAMSYNDDFWVLGAGEFDERGFRPFRLLSKRPLFHGRQVYVTCGQLCTFGTMSFSGSENETRPHIQLDSMLLSRENMFLCSLEELKNGCDASVGAIDKVPVMLSVLEDMLEAAAVFPEVGS